MLRTILFTLAILLVMIGCKQNYEKIFKDNNEIFFANKVMLSEALIDVEKEYQKNWTGQMQLIIHVDSLSENNKASLKTLGIRSIEIKGNSNEGCIKTIM